MKANSPVTEIALKGLADAVAQNDLALADALLAGFSQPLALSVLPIAAEIHLRQRRWKQSADAFAQIPNRDIGMEMRRRLVVNLDALQTFRPTVYDTLLSLPGNPNYTVAASGKGLPTVIYRAPDGRQISLTPGADPITALVAIKHNIREFYARGDSTALCGMGDGYLLHTFAHEPPNLFMDSAQTVFVIEPEPQVLLNCLMIHEYAGAKGPIEQQRFQWFIGPQWYTRMIEAMVEDVYLPLPTMTIGQSVESAVIQAELQKISEEMFQRIQEDTKEVARYYANMPGEDLAEVFSSDRPRRPRVLLLTSRFTTVLQYSTRDASEAFGQIGCETRTIIEPSPHHRLTRPSLLAALRQFKPDLVFQIDHLRAEQADLFPPNLPFACWIQDHLPNLTDRNAAATVGRRDFILTGMGNYFCRQFGYPRRQLLDLPQLARVPIRPTHWVSNGDDLVYVSNWSKTPGQAIEELTIRWKNFPALTQLLEAVCQQLLSIYEAGGAVSTHYDLHEIIRQSQVQTGIRMNSPEIEHLMVESVFDRLNNTLYRHQAIGWAAEVAESKGLKLSLYGRGWESHPRFAQYARGPVMPGVALEELTRRSKINLQVEPYACFTHARLLTGLFAGGFFLIRDHPFNHLSQQLISFLADNGCASAENSRQAREMIDPSKLNALDALLLRCAALGEQVDCLEFVRDWERSQIIVADEDALPRMCQVLFNDRASLERAIGKYLADDELRQEIIHDQRSRIENRLSYASGLRRILRQMSEKIAAETATSEIRQCA